MAIKKVLILESGAALAEIVDHFLAKNSQFLVRRIAPRSHSDLCEALARFNPDMILMDDVIFSENYTKLMVFIKELHTCEIVVLHAQANHLHRFNTRHIELSKADDLVLALTEDGSG